MKERVRLKCVFAVVADILLTRKKWYNDLGQFNRRLIQ